MDDEEGLYAKLKLLNERLWEGRASRPQIIRWLDNFPETAHTAGKCALLYLLSRFMYFGDNEIRELVRALYRDCYRYPIMENVRRDHQHTTDVSFIHSRLADELRATRFLALGNPAESGTYLLYYFRQENKLPLDLFINRTQLFTGGLATGDRALRQAGVSRYIFIDDFCGSGNQAVYYSRVVREMKAIGLAAQVPIQVHYYVLVATSQGLHRVRRKTQFDSAECVVELDSSYKCFGDESRYFPEGSEPALREACEAISRKHGARLYPEHPLGYRDSQLLVGLHHNTPNNTLPIIWYAEDRLPQWEPIFRRYPKTRTAGGAA